MDTYLQLAATMLGKPTGEVSFSERRLAKTAFWAAFEQVSQFPGNEHLRTPADACGLTLVSGGALRCGTSEVRGPAGASKA